MTENALQERDRIYGCLLCLRLLARRFEFRTSDEVEIVEEIAGAALPPLLQVVQVINTDIVFPIIQTYFSTLIDVFVY